MTQIRQTARKTMTQIRQTGRKTMIHTTMGK